LQTYKEIERPVADDVPELAALGDEVAAALLNDHIIVTDLTPIFTTEFPPAPYGLYNLMTRPSR
jgi:hypothetical protein